MFHFLQADERRALQRVGDQMGKLGLASGQFIIGQDRLTLFISVPRRVKIVLGIDRRHDDLLRPRFR